MSQNLSTAVMQRRHSAVDALDYFPTPPWATRAFASEFLAHNRYLTPSMSVWEPACGEGHMEAVLREFSSSVFASDVHDYGKGYVVGSYIGVGLDVLACVKTDWIITNPPFNLAVEFWQRAIDEAEQGVALLLRSAWLEGSDRYDKIFRNNPPSDVIQYCERVPMTAGKWDPAASSATSYSWFVWRRDAPRGCHLSWIKPGARSRNERPEDFQRWAA